MIYKSKFYLHVDDFDELTSNISKIITLDTYYSLKILVTIHDDNIRTELFVIKNNSSGLTEDILVKDEFLTPRKAYIKNDLISICKTYVLKFENKIFMTKIFCPNMLKKIKYDYYPRDILNEIKITNFKNESELTDLLFIMFKYCHSDNLLNLFIEKVLYYGYTDIDEIIGDNSTVFYTNVINSNPYTLKEIPNLFYIILILFRRNPDYEKCKSIFESKIKEIYENIFNLRLSEMSKYTRLR